MTVQNISFWIFKNEIFLSIFLDYKEYLCDLDNDLEGLKIYDRVIHYLGFSSNSIKAEPTCTFINMKNVKFCIESMSICTPSRGINSKLN